jgi:putative endonuclease
MKKLDQTPKKSIPASAFVYLLRCADGSLYCGYSVDPQSRLKVHNAGKGARYTRSRLPVELVYIESCSSSGAALSREAEIKRLSRVEKLALIETTIEVSCCK